MPQRRFNMPNAKQKYRRRKRRQNPLGKLIRSLRDRPKLLIFVLACLLLLPILIYLIWVWASYPDITGCPAKYTRFTVYHTACFKGDHKRCGKVRRRGLTPQEKAEVLHAHNRWRDFVSQGREPRSGGMPMSSNMLEMVWDQELEDVAQKMANICEFEHDCNGCRMSNNFTVGQNLQIVAGKCQTDSCEGESGEMVDTLWAQRIDGYVTELDFFHYSRIPAANFVPDFPTGHVTQILWAKTWRLGCGYTLHDTNYKSRSRKFLTHYFVCHYGPSGNIPGKDMYKIGPPCSECPQGTCCGSSCNLGRQSYPALCMIVDPEVGPTQPLDTSRMLARCAWEYGNPVCGVQLTGNWERVPAYSGHYMMITLKGGETASLDYTYQFPGWPRGPPFACLVIEYRAGPSIASYRNKGTLTLVLKTDRGEKPKPVKDTDIQKSQGRFQFIMEFLNDQPAFTVSVRYSIAAGAISHILDIRELQYLNYNCGEYDMASGKGNGS